MFLFYLSIQLYIYIFISLYISFIVTNIDISDRILESLRIFL